MGLDLTFLPFDADFEELHFSHTILPCEREREAFSDLLKKEREKGIRVPENFTGYFGKDENGERQYGKMTETPYGDVLKYLTADEILSCFNPEYQKNKAIRAYIENIPKGTKIAIWWN